MVGWVSLPCAQAVMGVERGDALAASIATHGLAMVRGKDGRRGR